jgi:hypothetical protein
MPRGDSVQGVKWLSIQPFSAVSPGEPMSRTGWLILIIALAASVAITLTTRGHFVLIALPLLFGAPLAAIFRRRR